MKRKRFDIMTGLFLIFLLMACDSKTPPPDQKNESLEVKPARIVGLGRVEPELKILDLTSEAAGIVTKIKVEPGIDVKKGEILLELENEIQKALLNQAIARIQTQVFQIKASAAALASTRIKAENAKISFDRAKILLEQNAEAQVTYDLAKTEYESLLEEIKRLEAVATAEKKLLQLYEAEKDLASTELEKRQIKAPVNGKILAIDITVGSYISQQTIFGTFAPESPLTVWCEIDELFADQVKIGQKASIRLQGSTDILSSGQVIFAGPYLRKKSIFSDDVGDLEDRRIREVRILLGDTEELLIGTRVECVISIESQKE
jgi:multidrug efflux pump subunit AcrA (membrane-fusion protein)